MPDQDAAIQTRTQKIFLGNKKQVAIICPTCGKTKNMNRSDIKKVNQPIPARCKCGTNFYVVFEWRSHYRKPTDLKGFYIKSEKQLMVVENLSQEGLGFRIDGAGDLAEGDALRVEFTLDNNKKSIIRANVTVRHITDTYIGAEFCSLGEYEKKELAFYLMP